MVAATLFGAHMELDNIGYQIGAFILGALFFLLYVVVTVVVVAAVPLQQKWMATAISASLLSGILLYTAYMRNRSRREGMPSKQRVSEPYDEYQRDSVDG